MESNLKKLREVSVPWNARNREKSAAKTQLYIGVFLLIVGIFYFLPQTGKKYYFAFTMFFALFPIAGISLIMGSFSRRRKIEKLNNELQKLDSDKLDILEKAVNEVEGSDPQNQSDVFSFYHHEGSGKNRRTIFWHAKVFPNYIAVLRKPKQEIHFPDREDFRIFKGKKEFFTDDYSAHAIINGREFNIFISQKSYDKYVECLESAFNESSSTKPVPEIKKGSLTPDNYDDNETVKSDL